MDGWRDCFGGVWGISCDIATGDISISICLQGSAAVAPATSFFSGISFTRKNLST